jgi:hypothetical protein
MNNRALAKSEAAVRLGSFPRTDDRLVQSGKIEKGAAGFCFLRLSPCPDKKGTHAERA